MTNTTMTNSTLSDDYDVVPGHICPSCGTGHSLVREARDFTYTYRGRNTVIQAVHGEYCTACGEGFCDPDNRQDWQRMSDEMDAFSAQVDAEQRASIRAIRKRLHLNQKEAAALFGGGVNAFSEYERGVTQPHKSTVLLLTLLDKHPELLAEIRNAEPGTLVGR